MPSTRLYDGDLATFSTSLNRLKARSFRIALTAVARDVEALQVQMQSTTQCRSRNRLVSRPCSAEWPVLGNSTETLVSQLITVLDSQPSAVNQLTKKVAVTGRPWLLLLLLRLQTDLML